MIWLAAITVGAIVWLIYTLVINRSFLRCPHCGKRSAWRFKDVGDPEEEYDEDGNLVATSTRQTCTGCGGGVIQRWSDYAGREIRKA